MKRCVSGRSFSNGNDSSGVRGLRNGLLEWPNTPLTHPRQFPYNNWAKARVSSSRSLTSLMNKAYLQT